MKSVLIHLDRGTWLATKEKDKIEMAIVLEGAPALFNQYGVMAVNTEKYPHVKYKEVMEFINWLISKEGQDAIALFKDKYGNQLFIPNAKLLRSIQLCGVRHLIKELCNGILLA